MPRLVEPEFATAGELERGHETEALVADGPGKLDSLAGVSLSSATGWVLALFLGMAGEKGRELRRLLRRIRRKGTEHEQSHASMGEERDP